MKKKLFLLGLMILVGFQAFSAGMSEAKYNKAREAAKHRVRRVIQDNDGDDMPYYIVDNDNDGDIDKQDFWDCNFTGLLGTQTDTVVYCTWSAGFSNFTHETKIGTIFERKDKKEIDFSNNQTRHFIDNYSDSLDMAVEFCREHDMEIVWSMRMNDDHDRGYEQLFPPLKYNHPEWLMGTESDAIKYGSWTDVDYTHQEIRDLAFQYVQEVCQNYDVDGVMLDFFRSPVLFKSHALGGSCSTEEQQMMTDLIADIRAMADEEGRKKGHPILVWVRTPDNTELCKNIGLDIEKWMDDKLIDVWVPTGYWRHNSREDIIALAHSYDIPVYPSLDESRVTDSIARSLRNTENAYSGRAAAWLQSGADGIYSFNYDTGDTRYGHFSRLDYLGSLETLASKDKTYTTSARGTMTSQARDVYDVDKKEYVGFDYILPGEQSRIVSVDKAEDVNILIADDCSVGSPDVKLRVRSDAGINPADLDVSFNGNPVTLAEGGTTSRMYLDSAVGYTVEWRVKWLDDNGVKNNYMIVYCGPQEHTWWGLTVNRIDGKVYASFYKHEDAGKVLLDSDPANTSWHKLRIAVSDGHANLYVDNSPSVALSVGFVAWPVLPLLFGDVVNKADGTYEMDYLYAYAGAALPGGTDPDEWTMRYDCDVHPTSESAITYSDGTTGSWAQNFGEYAKVKDGILTMNTMGSNRGAFFKLSEPSWYEYTVSPEFVKQGSNTVNFKLKDGKPVSIDDFVVEINY